MKTWKTMALELIQRAPMISARLAPRFFGMAERLLSMGKTLI
jgi:hypothetical protein